MIIKVIRKIIKNILPYGVVQLIIKTNKNSLYQDGQSITAMLDKLAKNIEIKDKEFQKRCFILGTGPSINNQNVNYIKDEVTICLNMSYLHKDYLAIKPNYHIFSGLA